MNWYYVEAGQQRGPVPEADLERLFSAGTIQADTLIWHEGLANWQPYSQLKPAAGRTSPSPNFSAPPMGDEAVCAECGKVLPKDQVLKLEGSHVCATCKPIFVQKLREGAATNYGAMEYAGFGIRFGAKVLDGIILWIVNAGLGFVVGMVASKGSSALALQLILIPLSLIINFGYSIFFLGKYGATPGKMACKLKVVSADGSPLGFGRAAGRSLAEILSALICYIGYIMAGFDDEKRALHDRLCNTRVIKREG